LLPQATAVRRRRSAMAFVQIEVSAADKTPRTFVRPDVPPNLEISTNSLGLADKTTL
jgi:hypothetical protein